MSAQPRHHANRHPLHPGKLKSTPEEIKANLGVAGETSVQTRMQASMPAVPRVTQREGLSARFIRDLHNHWTIYGPRAIHEFYKDSPGRYCLMVAATIPKHIDVRSGGIDEFRRLSVEDVRALMREAVSDALAEQGATVDGEHEYIVDEQLTLLCGPATGEARDAEPGPAHGDAEAGPRRGVDPELARG